MTSGQKDQLVQFFDPGAQMVSTAISCYNKIQYREVNNNIILNKQMEMHDVQSSWVGSQWKLLWSVTDGCQLLNEDKLTEINV